MMGTLGMMNTDSEIRVDFEKLRKDRLQKANDQLKKEGLGAVLVFEPDNIRYITATRLGEGFVGLRVRYALLCRDKAPILFEMGSAIPTKKKLCPWLEDIRPTKNDMKGIVPPACGENERGVDEIVDILRGYGLEKEPLGMDTAFLPWILGLQKRGVNVVDGLQCMLNAQAVKTPEEIYLCEMSAAAVDAAFYRVLNFARPGVKESDVVNLIRTTLFELGAENVLNASCVTGNRSQPHPHDFSDRVIRPGDMIFMDVVNEFLGYKTCYYRTLVCGKPTEEQQRIYNKAYGWLQEAIAVVKPGITTADIANRFPSAQELGYANEDDALLLQLAHGIGITHWAKPVVTRGYSLAFPEEIKEGMVIAFENYCGEGYNGARIEEELVVTKDGYEIISKFPCDKLLSCW